MSSSSTNKQPLLVDRPLQKFATLGATPALSSSTNFSGILGGGCTLLVDGGGDGATIDSLSIIATEISTTAAVVLFFLSSSPTPFGITTENTALVASAAVVSNTLGQRTNVPLPPLSVPVPNLGADTTTTETAKKNTGLLIEAGQLLYVGLDRAITAPTPLTKIHVFAQGGFY